MRLARLRSLPKALAARFTSQEDQDAADSHINAQATEADAEAAKREELATLVAMMEEYSATNEEDMVSAEGPMAEEEDAEETQAEQSALDMAEIPSVGRFVRYLGADNKEIKEKISASTQLSYGAIRRRFNPQLRVYEGPLPETLQKLCDGLRVEFESWMLDPDLTGDAIDHRAEIVGATLMSACVASGFSIAHDSTLIAFLEGLLEGFSVVCEKHEPLISRLRTLASNYGHFTARVMEYIENTRVN